LLERSLIYEEPCEAKVSSTVLKTSHNGDIVAEFNVVARSNEAKALGIPMGAPYYQYKPICDKHHIEVFSSNYTLYGDLSKRVMDSLRHFCPTLEVYSIDEAFLQLDSFTHYNLIDYSTHIRCKINQWIGIPVSIGIAPTKTLAKIANHVAKKHMPSGVYSLLDKVVQEEILPQFEVSAIWGIGRQLTKKLQALGISTAKQLRDTDPKMMRRYFGVVVERMVYELRGIACLNLEAIQPPKKAIMASRSFGKAITTLDELEAAVSNYVAKACEKLRRQQSKAHSVYTFIQTNPFKNQPQYSNGILLNLIEPSADTALIISVAKAGLRQIYRKGFHYKKAGIMLTNIVAETVQQEDLFYRPTDTLKRETLLAVIDNINRNKGMNTLFYAAQGTKRPWQMRAKKRSKRHTTCWDELAIVVSK